MRCSARARDALDLPRPIFLYVGRVAVEKNLEAMLDLDLPGSTVDRRRRPGARRAAAALSRTRISSARASARSSRDIYASADVFVFPSRTDTFGIVLIEAMASGLPVAAFPVTGPLDVIGDSGAGRARRGSARSLPGGAGNPARTARAHSLKFTWRESARQFLGHVEASRNEARDCRGCARRRGLHTIRAERSGALSTLGSLQYRIDFVYPTRGSELGSPVMQVQISKWENSLGLRLPQALAAHIGAAKGKKWRCVLRAAV